MTNNEIKDFVIHQYDYYLQKTEGRGISYGEIAYIQGLNSKELEELYKELEDNIQYAIRQKSYPAIKGY